MNKMHILAKIALASVALYTIIITAFTVLNIIAIICSSSPDFNIGIVLVLVATLLSFIVITAVIAQQLLFRADKWADKIIGTSDSDRIENHIPWLPVTYRIVLVCCGILILYWTTPQIFGLINRVLIGFQYKEADYRPPQLAVWPSLASYVIRMCFGAYLLFGAPHFVRWQVTKTLVQYHAQAVEK